VGDGLIGTEVQKKVDKTGPGIEMRKKARRGWGIKGPTMQAIESQ